MGLLLSILVGCAGVLELLASLERATNGVSGSSTGPTTPCLSYHRPTIENPSFHDSLCIVGRSGVIPVPESARRKLENLHEYSLRVRSELRSFGGSDRSTLSDRGNRNPLSPSRTESRQSLDSDLALGDREDVRGSRSPGSPGDERTAIFVEVDEPAGPDDKVVVVEEIAESGPERSSTKTVATADGADEYATIPTPIPLRMTREISRPNSSPGGSFGNESGNEEAPTGSFFDRSPVVPSRRGVADSSSSPESSIDDDDDISGGVRKRGFARISRSRSPDVTRDPGGRRDRVVVESSPKFVTNEVDSGDEVSTIGSERVDEEAGTSGAIDEVDAGSAKDAETDRKRSRSSRTTSTVLRKPTRLKSKNAEISKSAENLTARAKRTKRRREPERRRSDVSVQTTEREDSLRDEWTNTSPTDSETSISASRTGVSVEVQTSFDDRQPLTSGIGDSRSTTTFVMPVVGSSESRRDVGIGDGDTFGRRAFGNGRFATSISSKSRSLDDYADANWIPGEIDAAVVGGFEDLAADNRKKVDAREPRFDRNDREPNGWRSSGKDTTGEPKAISSFTEEDSVDEEFLDAEELIFSGEYTKAMNKDWHSGHFCCWQCDESLTGQRYVLRDEHPYCIKCYESVFANGCEECSKIIGIDSKDLSYKDKHWHEACFLCNKCRVSLVDKQFGSKVDKIYCGNCYDAQFASRCDGCGEIFRAGTKKMEYKTRQWHEKCFCCVVCKAPIGTKSFIPREQEIYCAGCYEDKFATRCVKCNKIITSGGVTYKNEPWHRDCFTCSNCNNSLAGQRFTSRDEKPYCAECFGELFAKRCTACTKPITGIGGTRFISFEDRHWHNNCFICAGCNTSLVGRGFITDGDDIICPECAKQKLSE